MYNVWKNVLAEIEQKISAANFSTWFQDTSLVSAEDGIVIIGVKNSFYVKQLRSKFLNLITDSLTKNGVEVKTIDLKSKPPLNLKFALVKLLPPTRSNPAPKPLKKPSRITKALTMVLILNIP